MTDPVVSDGVAPAAHPESLIEWYTHRWEEEHGRNDELPDVG